MVNKLQRGHPNTTLFFWGYDFWTGYSDYWSEKNEYRTTPTGIPMGYHCMKEELGYGSNIGTYSSVSLFWMRIKKNFFLTLVLEELQLWVDWYALASQLLRSLARTTEAGLGSEVFRFDFVAAFPYLAEDDCRVKAIEDGEWHWNVSDDDPRPISVELQLDRVDGDVSATLLQRVEGPHGEVGH